MSPKSPKTNKAPRARAPRRYFSTPEFAEMVGVSRQRAHEMCARGQVPALRIGRRFYVDADRLDRAVTEQTEALRAAVSQ